jgi:hypothetical protein
MSVASFAVFVEIVSLVFLFFLNLNDLMRQMLYRCGQKNVLLIDKKFNVVQSLASLPVSRRASSRLINANDGSLLIGDEDNLIIMGKFSWILQNSSNMLSFFHLIHTFVIVNWNMCDVLNGRIIVVILPDSEIHIVFKRYICVAVILVLLSDLRKDVEFLFVVGVVGVDKHVLVIWSNVIKLINSDILVLTLV